ncbi:Signal transducer and activator of transcription 1 [Trichinella pseudospiralis]|uniref:Signal transducer and activator of transcription n=1 Tax=Trichinella pseudospiralis TaxID=6337 RepID=A0A0V1JMN0_TRIPS|nr:Signal transducer and activator of transcription 1 [Trichinella pseudospiralis]
MSGTDDESAIQFRRIVRQIFDSWVSVDLIRSGQLGGTNTDEKLEWMIDVVVEMMISNKSAVDPEYIEEYLEIMFDNEFNMILEDGSSRSVSRLLSLGWDRCRAGETGLVSEMIDELGMRRARRPVGIDQIHRSSESSGSSSESEESMDCSDAYKKGLSSAETFTGCQTTAESSEPSESEPVVSVGELVDEDVTQHIFCSAFLMHIYSIEMFKGMMDPLDGSLTAIEMLQEELCTVSKECDIQWKSVNELHAQFISKLGFIQNLRTMLSLKQDKNIVEDDESVPNAVTEISKALISGNKQAGKVYELLSQARKALISTLKKSTESIENLRKQLIDGALREWKHRQKLSQIGYSFEEADELLDRIGKSFESLAEEVWTILTITFWFIELLEQTPKLPDNNVSKCLPAVESIRSLLIDELKMIIQKSFIVSKQPNVVLKQHNKFNAEVRLLVGDKLGIKFFNVKVTVKLISEDQAQSLEDGTTSAFDATTVAKIGISSLSEAEKDFQEENLEVERQSKRVKATFKSKLLKVDSRKPMSKNVEIPVCERNYALLFTCTMFKMGDITFDSIWALSCPVKLTVHGSQERLSQAMILWNHAFAPAENPFNIPKAVEWSQLAEALKYKFKCQTGATRPLSDAHLKYIAGKLVADPSCFSYETSLVTLEQFCKLPMREDVDFSFWSWFFEIAALIKQKLLRLWDDGLITGFISREDARSLLLSLHESCFLLRFSDSHLGGLSISFSAVLEDGRRREVFPLAPFTGKDLDHLSLCSRIARCPQLLHIGRVYGAESCYDKSVIFREEAEGKVTSQMLNKEAYPYITSELIMVAHTTLSGIADCETTPVSPLNAICPSPGDDLSQICESCGITSDILDNPVDLNNFDWDSLGVFMIPTDQEPMDQSEFFSFLQNEEQPLN